MTRALTPSALVALAADPVFLRYGAASVVALGADVGSFLLLLHIGCPPMPASAISYGFGIVVHWLVSSRVVFGDSVAPSGAGRTRQKLQFVGTALVGLALTTAIVGVASALGLDPRLAKLVAIGASFITTWALRRRLVFA